MKLIRVIQHEAAFTDEETTKLANSFKITPEDLELVLTTCNFFLSQVILCTSMHPCDVCFDQHVSYRMSGGFILTVIIFLRFYFG